jgi:hypothetical protein
LVIKPLEPGPTRHIGWQVAFPGAEDFTYGGAKQRIGNTTILGVAALDAFDTGGVRVIFGTSGCGQSPGDAASFAVLGNSSLK